MLAAVGDLCSDGVTEVEGIEPELGGFGARIGWCVDDHVLARVAHRNGGHGYGADIRAGLP